MELNQVTKTNIVIMSKWMKFIAIMLIVIGAMYCATCILAIVGWIPILLGVWALNSSKNFRLFADQNNEQAFDQAISKLKSISVFIGVLYIIGIVFMVIYIIAVIVMIATGAFAGSFDQFRGLFNN